MPCRWCSGGVAISEIPAVLPVGVTVTALRGASPSQAIQVSTPEAATAHFKRELAKYAALVKKAGVEPQ